MSNMLLASTILKNKDYNTIGLYNNIIRIHNVRKMDWLFSNVVFFVIASHFYLLGQTHYLTTASVHYESPMFYGTGPQSWLTTLIFEKLVFNFFGSNRLCLVVTEHSLISLPNLAWFERLRSLIWSLIPSVWVNPGDKCIKLIFLHWLWGKIS